MAEDLDVEAMLEAPYTKYDDHSSSSKHRSDKHSSDRHRHSDREKDVSRKRSRSRERKKSRDRESRRSRDRDDKESRYRDKDRDREHRSHREHRDRDKERDKRRSRDKDVGKGRDRERDYRRKERTPEKIYEKEKEREKEKVRSRDVEDFFVKGQSKERSSYRSRSRGEEPITSKKELEELPPEERDLRTVFCMQLSQRIRAKDLEEFFSSVGKVRDVRLITCNKTRRFKGIAYIEFKDAESVPLALGLTGQKLLGIPIIVQHTQAEKNRMGNTLPNLAPKNNNGPTRLYVGSLHFNITEDMLRGIFEPFGKIDNIQLNYDTDTGKSKGYGFIQFHHALDAKKALEQLNGFELAGRPMKVGNVTERSDGTLVTGQARMDSDELVDRAGIDLGATGRLQLMFKLAEGTDMQVPAGAASALLGAASLLPPQPQLVPPIATQCFMLNNMFDPATESNLNWDSEIRDDVIDECNKHGGVLHVLVDTASVGGNVYVKCPTIATAVASVNSLHGRWFAGRVITAAYVPVLNYHSLFPDAMTSNVLLLPTRGINH